MDKSRPDNVMVMEIYHVFFFAVGDLAMEVEPYGSGGGRAMEEKESIEKHITFFGFKD